MVRLVASLIGSNVCITPLQLLIIELYEVGITTCR